MTFGEELDLRYYTGLEEGMEKGMNTKGAEAVDAIVSKFKVSLEEACETIGLTVEEYNSIKAND